MIYLILLWLLAWCIIKLVKPESVPTVLIITIILALVIVFGLPHFYPAK